MSKTLLDDWQKHVKAFLESKTRKRRLNSTSAKNYLAVLDAGKKPKYRQNRFTGATAAKRIFEWLQANEISAPAANDIEDYLVYLQGKGLSLTSINKTLTIIRGFFGFLDRFGIYENRINQIESFRINKRVGEHDKSAITPEMFLELEKMPDQTTLKGVRDIAALNLGFWRGLRLSSIVAIQYRDFFFNPRENRYELRVRAAKRKTGEITMRLPDIVGVAVENYIKFVEKSGVRLNPRSPLFFSISAIKSNQILPLQYSALSVTIKKYINALVDSGLIHSSELHRYTAHSLRHGFVTFLNNNGMTIDEARILSEHMHIQTTLNYSQSANREKLETAFNNTVNNYISTQNIVQ